MNGHTVQMDSVTIQRIKAFIALRRRRSLTYDEKMDILWLQATLREASTYDVTGVISQLLGRVRKTVKGVLAEYLATGNLSVAPLPSNSCNHRSRVPNTHDVRALIQRFIRD